MSDFSNGLTAAEEERLAILLEEMGEALQVIGKIQRHGYESWDPTQARDHQPTNRVMLEKEIGDVMAAMELLAAGGDVDNKHVMQRIPRKLQKLYNYIHHNADILSQMMSRQP